MTQETSTTNNTKTSSSFGLSSNFYQLCPIEKALDLFNNKQIGPNDAYWELYCLQTYGLKLVPGIAAANFVLGEYYFRMFQQTKNINAFNKAIEHKHFNALKLQNMLAVKAKNFASAISTAENTGNYYGSPGYFLLCTTYFEKAKLSNNKDDYKQALKYLLVADDIQSTEQSKISMMNLNCRDHFNLENIRNFAKTIINIGQLTEEDISLVETTDAVDMIDQKLKNFQI